MRNEPKMLQTRKANAQISRRSARAAVIASANCAKVQKPRGVNALTVDRTTPVREAFEHGKQWVHLTAYWRRTFMWMRARKR